ncbi:uncharacterized protein LOC126812602 [Patella vulgata]|uniref:uncharacterized protein LOC126812602 n=1 Tax=Patella vulgata TaxID=6465 RepID=UPI002180027A|nr:uncharacterized protein LOC126812602 [Patella vulgata]
MRCRIFLLLILTTFIHCFGNDGLISRCLFKRREHIYFSCPKGHVIYRPMIFLGKGNQSTCSYEDGDCIGQSLSVLKQNNKCYWRESCSVGWRNGQVILKTDDRRCTGETANYVAYSNPLCIKEEHLFSICDASEKEIDVIEGVIRSHAEYPWSYGSAKQKCTKYIAVNQGYTLKLMIDDVETQDGDSLVIRDIANDVTYNVTTALSKTLTIISGLVEINFITSPGVKIGRGFVIRFQKERIRLSTDIVNRTYSDTPQVFASIEECINSKTDRIRLTCPLNHVIYKPEVSVGASNNNLCYHRDGDCTGLIHTLLAQRNGCYWLNSCNLSWQEGIPITMTSVERCFILMPSYTMMSYFQCVPKGYVYNICDDNHWEIKETNGLIKSHDSFPWNYPAVTKTCRKRLRVNKKYGVRIFADDFDLDLDTSKERVNIWYVSPNGHRVKRKKLRGNDTIDFITLDGCIDIEFKTSEHSKTGRGFVFKFELAVTNQTENDVIVDEVGTCGGKSTYFPKRPKRNERKHKVKKGK